MKNGIVLVLNNFKSWYNNRYQYTTANHWFISN